MRHLILASILLTAISTFAAAPTALPAAKSETSEATVNATLARGALNCSYAKQGANVSGVILDDNSQGISFEYLNVNGTGTTVTFTHKFIGKTTAADGKVTIHGHLVSLTSGQRLLTRAKGWFSLNEEVRDREVYSAFQYKPIYKFDGSIDRANLGRIIIRCPNLKEVATYLPELTEEQVNSLQAANTLPTK